MMTIAIAGYTGLTGSACLKQLLEHPGVDKVITIGRRSSGIVHARLQETLLQDGKLTAPVKADAFISCLGTTLRKAGSNEAYRAVDLELPLYLAQELAKQGCSRMAVISSMGANTKSPIFYNHVKGELESALKKMPWEALHILRPSFIQGKRKENRPLEKIGSWLFRRLDPLLSGSYVHYRTIKAETLAAGLIAAVMREANGQFIYLSGEIKKISTA